MLSRLLGLAKSFWLWGLKLSILKMKLSIILIRNISVIKQTIVRGHLYKILQNWLSNCDYFIKYFFLVIISAKIKSSFSVKFRYSGKIFSNFVNFSKNIILYTKFQTFFWDSLKLYNLILTTNWLVGVLGLTCDFDHHPCLGVMKKVMKKTSLLFTCDQIEYCPWTTIKQH